MNKHLHMLVKEVMTKKVWSIDADASFAEIVHFLGEHNIAGAPVVDRNESLVGIVSEKDLLHNVFPSEADCCGDPAYYFNHDRIEKEAAAITKLKAKDLMSRKVVTVRPTDHILRACSLLLIHDIRRLPVIEDHTLVGIVTTSDIYQNFLLQYAKN